MPICRQYPSERQISDPGSCRLEGNLLKQWNRIYHKPCRILLHTVHTSPHKLNFSMCSQTESHPTRSAQQSHPVQKAIKGNQNPLKNTKNQPLFIAKDLIFRKKHYLCRALGGVCSIFREKIPARCATKFYK